MWLYSVFRVKCIRFAFLLVEELWQLATHLTCSELERTVTVCFCHGAAFKVTYIKCSTLYIAHFWPICLLAKGKYLIYCYTMCCLRYCVLFVYNESVSLMTTHAFPHTACSTEAASNICNSGCLHTQLIKMFTLFHHTVHQGTSLDVLCCVIRFWNPGFPRVALLLWIFRTH